jgi:hypothetical protein
MFYLNHDNMDDLFREAAENLQPETDAAYDWNRIEQALHESSDDGAAFIPEKKKKRRFIFWYLLFIPLGWLGHYEWTQNFGNAPAPQHSIKPGVQDKAMEGKKPEIAHSKAQNIAVSVATNTKQIGNTYTTQQKQLTEVSNNNNVGSFANMLSAANGSEVYVASENEIGLTATPKVPVNNENAEKIALNTMLNTPASTLSEEKSIASFERTDSVAITPAIKKNTNSIEPPTAPLAKAAKKTISVNKKQSGFYVGVLFAPDLSFIKMQRTSTVGTSYGIIVGYQINNKWSVETGYLFDKKNYYTKGAYFDKSNVPYLMNKDIVSVDGKCEMTEVPITVRYTVGENKKGRWLANMGTSAYFMKEEYYGYILNINGQNQFRDRTYYPSSNKLFAVLNIGGGYERKIGSSFNVRAEPYLKIALGGIGTGNLPMSGTGINISITKSFR